MCKRCRDNEIGFTFIKKNTMYLDSVLEAVQLPASVSDLNSSLSNVNGNNLAHLEPGIEQYEGN